MDSTVIEVKEDEGKAYSSSYDSTKEVFGVRLGPRDIPEEINVCDCEDGWNACIGFPRRPLGALASVLTIVRLLPWPKEKTPFVLRVT